MSSVTHTERVTNRCQLRLSSRTYTLYKHKRRHKHKLTTSNSRTQSNTHTYTHTRTRTESTQTHTQHNTNVYTYKWNKENRRRRKWQWSKFVRKVYGIQVDIVPFLPRNGYHPSPNGRDEWISNEILYIYNKDMVCYFTKYFNAYMNDFVSK